MTANLLNTLLSTPESHVTYPLNPPDGGLLGLLWPPGLGDFGIFTSFQMSDFEDFSPPFGGLGGGNIQMQGWGVEISKCRVGG